MDEFTLKNYKPGPRLSGSKYIVVYMRLRCLKKPAPLF